MDLLTLSVINTALLVGALVILILLLRRKDSHTDASEKYLKLKNPGCPTAAQAKCSMAYALDGSCGGDCVECSNDPEGSGCVPKSCAQPDWQCNM